MYDVVCCNENSSLYIGMLVVVIGCCEGLGSYNLYIAASLVVT